MGLPVSVALRGRHADDGRADEAWAAVVADLREADRVFSTYRPDSVISRLGRGEIGRRPARGRRGAGASASAPASRRVVSSTWSATGVLDPSGVVKGWAVERAAAALRDLDDTDFCLSAGGDMVVHVADPDRPDWRVGIEDATDPTRVRAVVPLRSGAVATSGLAHRGAHVVDARTGVAPTRARVGHRLGPDLTWADIEATTALAMDAEAAAVAGPPRAA